MLFKVVIKFLLALSFVLGSHKLWAVNSKYASNSVLATGTWKKVRIEKNGVYKITYAELLKMGFNDPMKVSVLGYGGWPLDEDFTKPYIDDLPVIPVWHGDGYLLFYGKGCRKWEYSAFEKRFVHTNNPYSEYGCYFLTDDIPVKKMERMSSIKGEAKLQITEFDEYLLHETERVSSNKSGRKLYGENLSGLSTDILIKGVEGMTDNKGEVWFHYIERTTTEKEISLFVDGNKAGRGYTPIITSGDKHIDYLKGKTGVISGSWEGKKNKDIKIQIQSKPSLSNSAYLDYVYLQGKRVLQTYNEPYIFFRSLPSINNTTEFIVQNANKNTLVFDVTDGFNVKLMETSLKGNNLSFSIPAGALREFVLVQPDKRFSDVAVENLPNQNLHGLLQSDMIIISPSDFKKDADRLANIHREKDNLSVIVVTPEEIYNEFSSGTPDATAYRRFVKMFYDRSKDRTGRAPKYLLLFGDGAYDNRFLTKEWKTFSEANRKNMLLTYQTEESLNAYSYVTDDYFGLLDDDDEIFRYEKAGSGMTPKSRGLVDIGIGRLPVRTSEEAKAVVDKIISYMTDCKLGIWKNSLCFLADDGNGSDGFSTVHVSDADNVASSVYKNRPEYIVNKIYFDSYKKYAVGIPYPDVNKTLQRKLNEGLLVLDYVGHGGTEALSDEKVITHNDILGYKYEHLPLWITTTCDFCRFDDIQTSAGEDVFLNKKSGGIALFTTSRVSFTDINRIVNNDLISGLFVNEGYKNNSLGDIIKSMKRNTTDGRKLGFCLIGDPALRLSYPQYNVSITSINEKPVGDSVVQFKAFEKVTISGYIQDALGNTQDDFSGQLDVQIFDGKTDVTTQGNNGNKYYYEDYVNVIYKGGTTVSNGRFKLSFVVPKDISYTTTNKGKMSLYAFNEATRIDAQGYYDDFVVGGTSDTPEIDNEAPEIRAMFFNDSAFVNGGKVNSTPYFYARLWDKSGINVTGSSVGHDVTLYIDDNPIRNYNLNDYYKNIPDKHGEGEVGFSVPKLESGLHYAEFKVWDVMNNVRTDTITFEVVEGLKPFICDLKVFPNPARESAQFYFSHNRPESRMDVEIAVYDMAGRLQWKHKERGSSDFFNGYTVNWDLRGFGGSKLRPGVYLYRASISTDNSKDATEAEKMIVLY